MLIKGLCDYYDMLKSEGKVLPEGYSNVPVKYKAVLTEDGRIKEIIPYQKKEGEKYVATIETMPKRTEKPGIEANIIEHRPLYIFGLNFENDKLTEKDKTGKARKSHEAFVTKNLEFIERLDSPVINAYRNFINNWKPERENENAELLSLGKGYGSGGFVFCLSGEPDRLLHKEPNIIERYEQFLGEKTEEEEKTVTAQCAVTGEKTRIARIHSKIKGVYGGLATGNVLVSFKNPSEESYGNEQSFNSNISEVAMLKYTEALNYILSSDKHKMAFDDVTIIFWAVKQGETEEDLFRALLANNGVGISAEQIEGTIYDLLKRGKRGALRSEELKDIDGDVDFYMAGLKPNSSRLSLKFLVKKKYADVLWNIAKFQEDLQTTSNFKAIWLDSIKRELVSPKSSGENAKANPALMSELFEAMVNGTRLPEGLLSTMVRRVKTDSGKEKINNVRAGLIRACINRNYEKEELKVGLDKENRSEAYLCGRLFAVLEKVQSEAAGGDLNRTIRDGYFASAATKPVMVFPKLNRLAQNHLKKLEGKDRKKYQDYEKMIGEIVSKLGDGFPDYLNLREQGEFIIGYYKQSQVLFAETKKGSEEK